MKTAITLSLQHSVQLGLIQQLRILCPDIFLIKKSSKEQEAKSNNKVRSLALRDIQNLVTSYRKTMPKITSKVQVQSREYIRNRCYSILIILRSNKYMI